MRCHWCNLKNPNYILYHDKEWGVKRVDDKYLLEMLILESFQAGLSFECILNKREAFRNSYDKFDIDIFLDTLVFTLFNNYLKSNNKIIYNMYLLTIEQRKKLYDKRVNKAIFTQSFLTKAWKLSRGMN